MLPRLFVEGELYINSEISLSENKFHYLINVLKCKEEENIILINGIDGEFSAKITKITNKRCEVKVSEKIKDYYRQNFLALAFSPIDKIDILVKSATELGVTDFYPIKTKYTKHMKINKILPNMIEAVEQCERLDLPIIHKMQTLESFLNNFNEEESLLIFCEERSNNNIIKDIQIENKKIYCLVGPEGGFSAHEKELVNQHKKSISISLGNLILRSETAAINIISILKNLIA